MPRVNADFDVEDGKFCEGSEEAKAKLAPWFHKYLNGVETEEGFKLTLRRVTKQGDMDVGSYTFGLDESVDELVDNIIEDAEEETHQYKGKVKFEVRIHGKGLRTVFSLKASTEMLGEGDFDDFDEELPNLRGAFGQMQRHTEVFAREMVASSRHDRTFAHEMIRELREENAQLKKQYFETIRLNEELQSMSFARQMEIQKLQKSEERKDDAVKMFKQLGPLLVNKVLGAGPGAGVETPVSAPEMILSNLFESLDETQQAKFAEFAGALGPVQQAQLMELQSIMVARQEAIAKQQAEAAKAPEPAKTNGSSSSNGFTHIPSPFHVTSGNGT